MDGLCSQVIVSGTNFASSDGKEEQTQDSLLLLFSQTDSVGERVDSAGLRGSSLPLRRGGPRGEAGARLRALKKRGSTGHRKSITCCTVLPPGHAMIGWSPKIG
jgi:hypothetical protein